VQPYLQQLAQGKRPVGSGIAFHAAAESLGHHSLAVRQKHYAQPAAIANAGTARVARLLDFSLSGKKASAEDLLRQLDPQTLVQLAELLAAGKGNGDPANSRGIDPQSIRRAITRSAQRR
jgi:hypothetical protein